MLHCHVVCAGDPGAALRLTSQLISLGADVSLRSRWTNMNALHYAAYFDVPELIRVLLKAAKPRGTHIYLPLNIAFLTFKTFVEFW